MITISLHLTSQPNPPPGKTGIDISTKHLASTPAPVEKALSVWLAIAHNEAIERFEQICSTPFAGTFINEMCKAYDNSNLGPEGLVHAARAHAEQNPKPASTDSPAVSGENADAGPTS